jgi:glucose/arabinose dehydrogenase
VLTATAGAALGAMAGCAGSEPDTPPPATSDPPSPTGSATASPANPTPTPTPSPPAEPSGPPRPRIDETIAENLDVPWGIDFLSSGDALVSERNTGRILKITSKGKVTTVGEIAGVVPPGDFGEGGLMGIALAPGDEETLFAFMTTRSDDRLVRVSLAGGKVGKPRSVLDGFETNVHHHGGRLLFDAEGLLYLATGDAGQSKLAQDRDALNGKILRLRPDGRAAPGNPFDNRTWSYGHRNIEGLAFDDAGRLWATEFGEQESDELNLIRKGRNYGWPRVEGRSNQSGLVSPEVVWSPTSTCSPAGLAITRSTAFLGALRGRCLFAVPLSGREAGKPKAHFAKDHGRIRSVVVAPDGALWMTTSNTDGRAEPGRDDDKILRVTL